MSKEPRIMSELKPGLVAVDITGIPKSEEDVMCENPFSANDGGERAYFAPIVAFKPTKRKGKQQRHILIAVRLGSMEELDLE